MSISPRGLTISSVVTDPGPKPQRSAASGPGRLTGNYKAKSEAAKLQPLHLAAQET